MRSRTARMTSLFCKLPFFSACAFIQAFRSTGSRSCMGLRSVMVVPHGGKLLPCLSGNLLPLRQAQNKWQFATMSDFPSQQQDKFVLRLPDGMRVRIRAAAEAGGRSMNSEIVARLETSFSEGESNPDLMATITEYTRKMDAQIADLRAQADRFREASEEINRILPRALNQYSNQD